MSTQIIPVGIKTYMAAMRRLFPGCDVYLSGGALAPHTTNDFDIVIISNYYSDRILDPMRLLYQAGMFDTIECYEAYGEEPGTNSEDDGKFHTKIVCAVGGVKVDFLFTRRHDYDIRLLMFDYPLSIQMQSLDFDGNLIQGTRYREDKIVVYQKGSAEEKYKTYYPDKEFIYADNT